MVVLVLQNLGPLGHDVKLLEGQDSQALDETGPPVGSTLPLAKVLGVAQRVLELADQLGCLVLDAGSEGRETVFHGLLHILAGGGQGVDQLPNGRPNLGILLVKMPCKTAHQEDHALPHNFMAGVVKGRVQEVLEHHEQFSNGVLAMAASSMFFLTMAFPSSRSMGTTKVTAWVTMNLEY